MTLTTPAITESDPRRDVFDRALQRAFRVAADAPMLSANPFSLILVDEQLAQCQVFPDSTDTAAVIDFMNPLVVAEYNTHGNDRPIKSIGLSPRQVARLHAYETLVMQADGLVLLQRQAKYPGFTRSHGSHCFSIPVGPNESWRLISAAYGWKGDYDYLAAQLVPPWVSWFGMHAGLIASEQVESETFVLQ